MHVHTHTHVCIQIYIYICTCMYTYIRMHEVCFLCWALRCVLFVLALVLFILGGSVPRPRSEPFCRGPNNHQDVSLTFYYKSCIRYFRPQRGICNRLGSKHITPDIYHSLQWHSLGVYRSSGNGFIGHLRCISSLHLQALEIERDHQKG